MGLYDEFIPNPPIKCPICSGMVSGWQGKPEGCALLIWKQGIVHPIDQIGDEECKAISNQLKNTRLPKEFNFMYGGCEKCDFYFNSEFTCTGKTVNGIWASTEITPSVDGKLIKDNHIQCSNCLEIFESNRDKTHDFCQNCHKLITINWSA